MTEFCKTESLQQVASTEINRKSRLSSLSYNIAEEYFPRARGFKCVRTHLASKRNWNAAKSQNQHPDVSRAAVSRCTFPRSVKLRRSKQFLSELLTKGTTKPAAGPEGARPITSITTIA